METIRITSEDEAFDLLRKLVEDYKFEESVEISFESWPRFIASITLVREAHHR